MASGNDIPSSLPPEARERRYGIWPYYLPPNGWGVDRNLASSRPLDWTCVRPHDRAAYNSLIEEIAKWRTPPQEDERDVPVYRPLIHTNDLEALERARSMGTENSTIQTASMLFARIPPSGRYDPHFVAYRMAQRQRPGDPMNPLVHPALFYHQNITTPDLTWDLTRPLNFATIARSAAIPLFPEEYVTPMTHPPLEYINVCLEALPGLSFSIQTTGPGGLMLGDVMQEIVAAMKSHIAVNEWNEMREDERNSLIRGYQRRTGWRSPYNGMQLLSDEESDETEFLLQDALEDKVMFLGLDAEPDYPEEWFLYTTTKAACRPMRSRSE